MKKPSFRERFQYWFDNRMSRGSLALIRVLLAATLAAVFLIAGLIFLLGASEEGDFLSALWDSFSTIVNAWMPSYEDGSLAYILLMALAALFGLLVTSVLIGIFASAMEEKIDALKKGNSRVLEKDHYVILGCRSGDFTLLRQLILAAAGKRRCIVAAGDMEKDRMEEEIRQAVTIPKNIRLICRTVDISSPEDLEKVAIPACRAVIINPSDDLSTARTLLAVTGLIRKNPDARARIAAIVGSGRYQLPRTVTERHNVSLFRINEVLARIIAHSCTQTGLAATFEEIFNFEGSEFYITDLPGLAGRTFLDVSLSLDGAVPVGIFCKEEGMVLSPAGDRILAETDRLVIFGEEEKAAGLTAPADASRALLPAGEERAIRPEGKTVLIGTNEVVDVVIRELPENIREIIVAGVTREEYQKIRSLALERRDLSVTWREGDPWEEADLLSLVRDAAHVILLHDHGEEAEESDMRSLMLILKLRDLRVRYALRYNITAEVQDEKSIRLIAFGNDSTDYIVASNMIALFLAQLAESPDLAAAFREILSNEGNELFLKRADDLSCAGTWTCAEIRKLCLLQGYVFLGYNIRGESGMENCFNPGLSEVVRLRDQDRLIVMGYD